MGEGGKGVLQGDKRSAGCCFRSCNTNAEICHFPVVLSLSFLLPLSFSLALFAVALSPLLTALTGRQDVQQQHQQQCRQITTTKCIVCKHVTKNNNNVQQTTITTTTSCIVCCLILRSVNDAEISMLFSPSLPTLSPLSLIHPLSLCLFFRFSRLCFPIFFVVHFYFILFTFTICPAENHGR